MNLTPDPQISDWWQVVFFYFRQWPMIGTLIGMMLIDIIMGLMLAGMRKQLSSSISWRGMCKKVMVLLLLGVAALIEPFAQGIPTLNLASLFFIVTEAISIMENAAGAGVPIPRALRDILLKLQAEEALKKTQRDSTTNTTTTIVHHEHDPVPQKVEVVIKKETDETQKSNP